MGWRSRVRRVVGGGSQWIRYGEQRAIAAYLDGVDTATMDGAGVTDGPQGRRWRTWTELRYPEFDLCAASDGVGTFDLVLCQHVLEHVVDPLAAVRTLRSMLRPGGHLIVVTPFLVKIHQDPIDLWRFTPDGLERLLRAGGFARIEVGSWGNAVAVSANLRIFVRDAPWVRWLGRWTRSQNPATPVAVWAFARV